MNGSHITGEHGVAVCILLLLTVKLFIDNRKYEHSFRGLSDKLDRVNIVLTEIKTLLSKKIP